jgi:hypothetical protein
MYGTCYKKRPCIYLEIDGFRKKYSSLAYRFGTDRHAVKEIFVDKEILLQIDGPDYWLWWIAYEPKLNVCLILMYLSRERRTICLEVIS